MQPVLAVPGFYKLMNSCVCALFSTLYAKQGCVHFIDLIPLQ